MVEVSSTSNQSAYRVILGLGHRSGCTKNNTVSLVDFFSTPFGVDTYSMAIRVVEFSSGGYKIRKIFA